MSMRNYTGIATVILVFLQISCSGGKKQDCKEPAEWNLLRTIVVQEIKTNTTNYQGVNRNIAEGEKVVNETRDTVNWQDELKLFSEMFDQASCFCTGMKMSADSSNGLVIREWTTTDSLCNLQKVKVVLKNKRIELLEVSRRHRSWVVNRDTRLALQPGKGYSILLEEDYLWSKPGRKEIFASYLSGQ